MDFVPDEKLELADKLLADLWDLCEGRLEATEDESITIREFNVRIADAINTLHQAYMIINLVDSKTATEPKGFVSYSKQVKSE